MSTSMREEGLQTFVDQMARFDERVRALELRSQVDSERWTHIYARFDKMEKDIDTHLSRMEKSTNERLDKLEASINKNSGHFTRMAWVVITPLVTGIIYLIIRGGLV